MKTAGTFVDLVMRAMSVFGALTIAAIFLLVLSDVLLRNISGASIHWASGYVEYALLIVAMLVAPGLVRKHAHIRVEILSSVLSKSARMGLERIVCVVVAGLCLLLAWHAATGGYAIFQRGEMDIRSVALPRWILFAVLAIGFFFCAVEFLREAFSKTPGPAGHGAGEHGI